jgi:hypothetical protein
MIPSNLPSGKLTETLWCKAQTSLSGILNKLIKEDHFSCVHHEKCLRYPNRSLYTNEQLRFNHTSSRCSDYSIVKEQSYKSRPQLSLRWGFHPSQAKPAATGRRILAFGLRLSIRGEKDSRTTRDDPNEKR